MDDMLTYTQFDESQSEQLAALIVGEKWPFHVNHEPTLEQVTKWISGGHFTGKDTLTFFVFLNDQTSPVGIVCLQELSDSVPVFDLRLISSGRNRGIGRKITDWLAEYVFTNTDKHKIEGHTRADNIPMRHVFKTCGWVKEAYYRQAWPDSSGNTHDALAYAILKSDWEAGTQTEIDWADEL